MKKNTVGRLEVLLSVFGIFVLAGAFGIWCGQNETISMIQWIAAFISITLFAVLIVRCIPEWLSFLCQPETNLNQFSVSRRTDGGIILLFTLSLLVHLGIAVSARLLSGKSVNLFEALQVYNEIDSRYYLNIAQKGYGLPDENGDFLHLVFFPGYPLLARAFMMIFQGEALSGYLASWVPFMLSGPVLYRLLRLDCDHTKAMRILVLMCLMPAAVFYSFPMSESLFLLLTVLCLYLARTHRWFTAGIVGMMTAFTRSAGVLLVVPLFFEGIRQLQNVYGRKKKAQFFIYCGVSILTVLFGTLAYLCINYSVMGNPLIFMQYQKAHWHQQMSWFFSTASTQIGYAVSYFSESPNVFWGLSVPNLFVGFSSVILMLLCRKKIRASYTIWFIIYYAVCYGASWLLSGPRYMAVFFPLAIAMEELPVRRWVMPLMCTVLTVIYTIFFALRWGVW